MGRLGESEPRCHPGLAPHGERTKVIGPMIHHEVVDHPDTVRHVVRRLGKLNIVLHTKGSESWGVNAD